MEWLLAAHFTFAKELSMTSLRQRFIEDMQIRNLAVNTQFITSNRYQDSHATSTNHQSEYVELLSALESLSVELLSSFPSGPPFYRNKGTARAALGDVSDALSLRVRVLDGGVST
jgi:hypothetical protein